MCALQSENKLSLEHGTLVYNVNKSQHYLTQLNGQYNSCTTVNKVSTLHFKITPNINI